MRSFKESGENWGQALQVHKI